MKLSVVIPCYNERSSVLDVLKQVRSVSLPQNWEMEIILVDDGSTDGTRELLRANPMHSVRVVEHEQNLGKGGALKTGFKEATGDYIIIQDADAEYNPNQYSKLLDPIISKEADIVFGSRNLGTNNVPYSTIYFYGGLLVCKFFNLFFRTNFSDITTCYKVFPRSVVPELLLQPSNDFVFDAIDLTYVLSRAGRIKEIAISYSPRTKKEGKKLNWKHGVKCLFAIARIFFSIDAFIRYLRLRKAHKLIKRDAVIFDVGCGPSYHFLAGTEPLIAKGFGVDKKTNHFMSDKLEILQHVFDTSGNDGVFPSHIRDIDQAFMFAVIEHLHHPESVVKNIRKTLKDDGEIFLTTPTTAAKPVLEFLAFTLGIIDAEEIRDHKIYFSKRMLIELLTRAGYHDIKHSYFEFGLNQWVLARKNPQTSP